jgi:hypothetical protein
MLLRPDCCASTLTRPVYAVYIKACVELRAEAVPCEATQLSPDLTVWDCYQPIELAVMPPKATTVSRRRARILHLSNNTRRKPFNQC